MKHGSLFSGIGGFDLAAEWMGWENLFHCEINPFGRKILKHYWPNAQSYEDIKKTDFSIWRGRIDILTGGFPCQPYSQAGQRKGTEDDRHLWPEMLRAISELSPRWVVGENVRGLTNWNGGVVFDQVQADLEAISYEVLPFLLPACAVNAPHRRDRIWFIAFNTKCNDDGRHNPGTSGATWMGMERNFMDKTRRNESANNPESSGNDVANPSNKGAFGWVGEQGDDNRQNERGEDNTRRSGSFSGDDATNSEIIRHEQSWDSREWRSGLENCDSDKDAADTSIKRCNNGGNNRQKRQVQKNERTSEENKSERDRWERRPWEAGAAITDPDSLGFAGEKHGKTGSGFITEKSGVSHWEDFPVESPLCAGDDGISSRLDRETVLETIRPNVKTNRPFAHFNRWRNESIKGGGNAIVPQIAYEIFKAIKLYENQIKSNP